MEQKKYGVLSSSVNPQEMSLLVQSLARVILGVIASLGYYEVTKVDAAIEEIPMLVIMSYTAWQALEALYGGVRKVMVHFVGTK